MPPHFVLVDSEQEYGILWDIYEHEETGERKRVPVGVDEDSVEGSDSA